MSIVFLVLAFLRHLVTTRSLPCDPRLPHCRDQAQYGNAPDCKPFWLIPGKANDCTKPSSKRLITIDPIRVQISPNPVKLPGCFTITMEVDIKDSSDTPKSYLAKVEYNWFNLPQFSSLPCQNSTANGCGGYGNNCYYCDVCRNLEEISKVPDKSQLVEQFKNIDCPSKAGTYSLKKEICFNDFNDLDKDHDCEFDFLQNSQLGANYKDAIKNLQRLGFGTVIAKFTLSHNATVEQQKSKKEKETALEQTIDSELEKKRVENNWALTDQQYITFRNWYIQYRKDTWHKQDYLPWLLYYNEIGCVSVGFEVCPNPPTPSATGATLFQCQ